MAYGIQPTFNPNQYTPGMTPRSYTSPVVSQWSDSRLQKILQSMNGSPPGDAIALGVAVARDLYYNAENFPMEVIHYFTVIKDYLAGNLDSAMAGIPLPGVKASWDSFKAAVSAELQEIIITSATESTLPQGGEQFKEFLENIQHNQGPLDAQQVMAQLQSFDQVSQVLLQKVLPSVFPPSGMIPNGISGTQLFSALQQGLFQIKQSNFIYPIEHIAIQALDEIVRPSGMIANLLQQAIQSSTELIDPLVETQVKLRTAQFQKSMKNLTSLVGMHTKQQGGDQGGQTG